MPTSPLSPLDADGIEAALAQAFSALTAAADLDELKTARLEHVGERSPLALANREIGQLAPADKAAAGKLLGSARGRLNAALAETPEEAENRIGQADDRARAAVARELERMQKEGIG